MWESGHGERKWPAEKQIVVLVLNKLMTMKLQLPPAIQSGPAWGVNKQGPGISPFPHHKRTPHWFIKSIKAMHKFKYVT